MSPQTVPRAVERIDVDRGVKCLASRTFYRKSLFPSLREPIPVVLQCSLILVRFEFLDPASKFLMEFYFLSADYAWGREGLDTIVTQLLNQMDNTGPPPLEKEKIEEIPKCEITQEQVDSKLQCSVCWEDFQLSEKVRQLPCSVSEIL